MLKEALLEPILRKLRIKRIIKHIPKNSVICDVGCGFDGTFLKSISHKISMGIGIDKKVNPYSDYKIRLIQEKMDTKLNVQSQMFDCITLLAVLEHLDYPSSILEECHRILKPNGVLILTTPTPLSKPLLEFLAFKLKIVSREEIEDHKYYFTGKNLTVYGDGSQTRSFCYVDELVDGIVANMNSTKFYGPINLGNPVEFTILELANKVIKLCKSSSKLVFKPLPEDDPIRRKPDITLAKDLLNFNPKTQLEEGLNKTIDYFHKQIYE
ncbi:MAG: class I SAM-dependent methyltransferase [Spirochaetota bacterium]|nr:class I SAM-dependent methyltransferase [Spirochaetota bacterium]